MKLKTLILGTTIAAASMVSMVAYAATGPMTFSNKSTAPSTLKIAGGACSNTLPVPGHGVTPPGGSSVIQFGMVQLACNYKFPCTVTFYPTADCSGAAQGTASINSDESGSTTNSGTIQKISYDSTSHTVTIAVPSK